MKVGTFQSWGKVSFRVNIEQKLFKLWAHLAGWAAACSCSTATTPRWPPSWRPDWSAASCCRPRTWSQGLRCRDSSPGCTWPPRCWRSAPRSGPPRSARWGRSSRRGWAPPRSCWASWSRCRTGGPDGLGGGRDRQVDRGWGERTRDKRQYKVRVGEQTGQLIKYKTSWWNTV